MERDNDFKWDLESIYRDFSSKEYKRDYRDLVDTVEMFKKQVVSALTGGHGTTTQAAGRQEAAEDHTQNMNEESSTGEESAWLRQALSLYNKVSDLFENLESYAYCRYSVDTQDKDALNALNQMEKVAVAVKDAIVLFRNALAGMWEGLEPQLPREEELKPYLFFLGEQIQLQKKQMAPALEELAADMGRCGSEAWSRLQETLSSTATVIWDESTGEGKTVVELRNLAFDPDRDVREKAYRKELQAWEELRVPLAYALNGVKGAAVILDGRRGYRTNLQRAMMQSRITPQTLESLIKAMETMLPHFRSYLKAKAEVLQLEKCAFYDIFAPVGKEKSWSYPEAKTFILEQFARFDDGYRNFACEAFDKRWIDVMPKMGKVGGAYCISFPRKQESRILSNFGGHFSDVSTLAHELGHAFHGSVLKDVEAALAEYPMTLAETASIFSESLVIEGALTQAADEEKIGILEAYLQDTTQVIVDILSRFYFERKVFEHRSDRELAPDELCAYMLEAQQATYGDGLDQELLHPYMWAVKSHYYRTDLSFYNYPYAFGQLFGLGLYMLYQKNGQDFIPAYIELLKKSGRTSALELGYEAGFDIEQTAFWEQGLQFIKKRIDDFVLHVS